MKQAIYLIMCCLLFAGCLTINDDESKKDEVTTKEGIVQLDPNKTYTADEVKAIKQKQALAFDQEILNRKLESDKDTRTVLRRVQYLCGLILLISAIAFWKAPSSNAKRWAIGGAVGSVFALMVCATCSFFLDWIRWIMLGLLLSAIITAVGFAVLWIRKNYAFKTVTKSAQKHIDADPEGWNDLVESGKIDHDEDVKKQVKDAKKQIEADNTKEKKAKLKESIKELK